MVLRQFRRYHPRKRLSCIRHTLGWVILQSNGTWNQTRVLRKVPRYWNKSVHVRQPGTEGSLLGKSLWEPTYYGVERGGVKEADHPSPPACIFYSYTITRNNIYTSEHLRSLASELLLSHGQLWFGLSSRRRVRFLNSSSCSVLLERRPWVLGTYVEYTGHETGQRQASDERQGRSERGGRVGGTKCATNWRGGSWRLESERKKTVIIPDFQVNPNSILFPPRSSVFYLQYSIPGSNFTGGEL